MKISRDRTRQREALVSEDERRQMRGVLGELNWLVSSSRPDLAAFCSLLQQKLNSACVKDLVEVNRAVALARDYANMEVAGRRVLRVERRFVGKRHRQDKSRSIRDRRCGKLAAKRDVVDMLAAALEVLQQRRQTASTLGAELLALSRAMAGTKWVCSLWAEAMRLGYDLKSDGVWTGQIPITACFDSKPVYDHINGQVMMIKDKRLAIEMLLVKQDVHAANISAKWVPTYQMLADSLTKCNGPAALLRRTLKEGRAIVVEDDEIKRWAGKK